MTRIFSFKGHHTIQLESVSRLKISDISLLKRNTTGLIIFQGRVNSGENKLLWAHKNFIQLTQNCKSVFIHSHHAMFIQKEPTRQIWTSLKGTSGPSVDLGGSKLDIIRIVSSCGNHANEISENKLLHICFRMGIFNAPRSLVTCC